MTIRLDDHVGEKLLAVDISCGCSPCFEVVVPATSNFDELIALLQKRVHLAIRETVGQVTWALEPLTVKVHGRSGIIKTPEERAQDIQKILDEVSDACGQAQDDLQKRIDEHPDNGKSGWWYLRGVRHQAHVRASSAREAVDKALAAEKVGDWELITVPDYLGIELPDVF